VLESFIQIFGMASTYFSEISAIPKSNELVPTQPNVFFMLEKNCHFLTKKLCKVLSFSVSPMQI
jgi:hypothetical protein